jgi:choline kinase
VRAIIVAAGKGSRLWPVTQRMPKTLLPYGDGTILSRIVGNFATIGVTRFTIVIGFKSDMIRGYLEGRRNFGLDISLIENPEYERGNGVSVQKARSALEDAESAYLSMSDHLVHPDGLASLRHVTGNALLTDTRIDEVFDIEDATKVRTQNHQILEIGKELSTYNAIDCGVFRIDRRFMDALDAQIALGKESISDGVRNLIATTGFASVPMPPHSPWIDIDTPAAYEAALGMDERLRRPSDSR